MWRGFQKPKRLASELETLTDRYGKFNAQPFERGFGTTIGNALRRGLLSSIEGAAITAVKIEGVLHEFQSIPGVVEDATDIILNLKHVPLRLHNPDAVKTLTLFADKPGEVTSAMIEEDADVEVLDKSLYLATVGAGGKLSVEMRVRNGRGYVGADRNFDEDLPIGYIPIDSVHSPVRKVNYTVEAARLGQMTDYEKLTVEVWTNGAVKPTDAVGLAAKLLKDHMSLFIAFEEEIPAESHPAPPLFQHPPRRRAGAANRAGHAAHQELRPQVPGRDQDHPGRDEPDAGDAPGRQRPHRLAAGGSGATCRRRGSGHVGLTHAAPPPGLQEAGPFALAPARHSAQPGHEPPRARAHHHHAAQSPRPAPAGRKDDYARQARHPAQPPAGRRFPPAPAGGEEALRHAGPALRRPPGRLHSHRARRLAARRRRRGGHRGIARLRAQGQAQEGKEAPPARARTGKRSSGGSGPLGYPSAPESGAPAFAARRLQAYTSNKASSTPSVSKPTSPSEPRRPRAKS